MELLYKKDLKRPYQPHKMNKDIALSDTLKGKFNCFYKGIQDSDSLKEEEWTKAALRLKQKVQLEVQQFGNCRSIYVTDYVEFIYGVCCLLIAKFDISQAKAGRILGVNATKFSKLGIYPKRSHSGYFTFDETGNKYKSLLPNQKDTEGIRIARFINENVRAVYECYGFAGVSNDLDLFANIFIDGKKVYYLTIPSEQTIRDIGEDIIRIFSICISRFLFATANNLGNDVTLHKAGEIKREIIRLLEMDDKELLRKSKRLRNMIQEGEGYEKYVVGKLYSFKKILSCYHKGIGIYEYMRSGNYIDSELGEEPDIWDEAELDMDVFVNMAEDIEENMEKIIEWLGKSVDEKEDGLFKVLSYRRKGNQAFDIEAFSDWLEILREFQKSGLVRELLDEYENVEEDSDKKIRAAAIFWILEVFAGNNVSESRYMEVMEYLNTSQLLSYFDSLNKEAGKENQIHLFLANDDFRIVDNVFAQDKKKRKHPFLVYVDMETYRNVRQLVERIAEIENVVCVARDKTGSVQEYGMQTLSPELNLYIKENRNGRV